MEIVTLLAASSSTPSRRMFTPLPSVSRRRQVAPVAAVSLAAALVYIFDPVATMRPGFDLSFAAVVLLLWLAKRGRGPSVIPRWLDAPRQLLIMQVFLLFGLLPLTALIFQRFAIVATPVNLVAVPVFSFVTVPLTLAALVVGDLSEGLAGNLLAIAAQTIDALDRYIEFMASLPMAVAVCCCCACRWHGCSFRQVGLGGLWRFWVFSRL